jgi:hypothetical protein
MYTATTLKGLPPRIDRGVGRHKCANRRGRLPCQCLITPMFGRHTHHGRWGIRGNWKSKNFVRCRYTKTNDPRRAGKADIGERTISRWVNCDVDGGWWLRQSWARVGAHFSKTGWALKGPHSVLDKIRELRVAWELAPEISSADKFLPRDGTQTTRDFVVTFRPHYSARCVLTIGIIGCLPSPYFEKHETLVTFHLVPRSLMWPKMREFG